MAETTRKINLYFRAKFNGVDVNIRTMSRLSTRLSTTLTPAYIDKLKEKNILTTTDFIATDPEELVQLTGIPFKETVAIRNVILAKHASLPVSGYDLYRRVVASLSILSTGAKGVDDILGGGLYMGEMTELVGDIAAGKTQLCFSACVTTAVDNEGHVIYIDTGRAFSANRIQQMLDLKGANKSQKCSGTIPKLLDIVQPNLVDNYLSRIQCYSAFTLFDVFSVIADIRERRRDVESQFYRDVKLVILDNIASVIYPLMGGESFTEYQALLSQLGHMLKALAVDYPCAVLVTNNFVKGDNNTRVASLGRIWSHVPHLRIGIDKVPDTAGVPRTVTVMKSCRGAVGAQGKFEITDTGQVK